MKNWLSASTQKPRSKKRIWPLDDEARVSTDGILLGEEEQGGRPLPPRRARATHSISCARRSRLLLHRLSRCFLRCGQPETIHTCIYAPPHSQQKTMRQLPRLHTLCLLN